MRELAPGTRSQTETSAAGPPIAVKPTPRMLIKAPAGSRVGILPHQLAACGRGERVSPPDRAELFDDRIENPGVELPDCCICLSPSRSIVEFSRRAADATGDMMPSLRVPQAQGQ